MIGEHEEVFLTLDQEHCSNKCLFFHIIEHCTLDTLLYYSNAITVNLANV